jgi:hypothetical protein
VRLVPLAATDTPPPPQVVVGAPVTLSDAGNVSLKFDCVRANAFELLNVTVNTDATFGAVVVGANVSLTVGATGLTLTAVAHALVPAEVGAPLVALVDPTAIVTTSVPPCESVTVSVRMPVPVTVTCAPLAPETIVRLPLAVHA